MHKLNLLVDNALIGLIQDLTEASKYDEASLVLNKVELEENLLRAADMIGSHLVVDKLTDRTTRKYLKCLMTSKISAKYAEQDLDF